MAASLRSYLAEDHERLDQLLSRAMAGRVAVAAYEEFRAGLLKHIAMEEKILLPDARARRGGEPLPIAARLRADHAALASLLVPSPTIALLRTVRDILYEHNPLEEQDGGVYDSCEQLAGGEFDQVLERMRAIPPVRVSSHVDEPRIHEHIARMLRARVR